MIPFFSKRKFGSHSIYSCRMGVMGYKIYYFSLSLTQCSMKTFFSQISRYNLRQAFIVCRLTDAALILNFSMIPPFLKHNFEFVVTQEFVVIVVNCNQFNIFQFYSILQFVKTCKWNERLYNNSWRLSQSIQLHWMVKLIEEKTLGCVINYSNY